MSIYDVTVAFNDLLEPVQLKRYTNGHYLKGQWVEGSYIITNITAAVMPFTGPNEPKLEGYEGREVKEFYTEFELKQADNSEGKPADILIYEGIEYIIKEVHNWRNIGRCYKAMGERQ